MRKWNTLIAACLVASALLSRNKVAFKSHTVKCYLYCVVLSLLLWVLNFYLVFCASELSYH